jgi:hypothetical protein
VSLREYQTVQPLLVNSLEGEAVELLTFHEIPGSGAGVEGHSVAALAQRLGNGDVGVRMTRERPYGEQASRHYFTSSTARPV